MGKLLKLVEHKCSSESVEDLRLHYIVVIARTVILVEHTGKQEKNRNNIQKRRANLYYPSAARVGSASLSGTPGHPTRHDTNSIMAAAVFCPQCLLNPYFFLPTATSFIMARALGVPLSFILVLFICVLFVFRRITGVNQAPANLDEYPDKHLIKANLSNSGRALGALFEPPLQTSGRYIIDNTGARFKLVSVNWYGASDKYFIPGGLDVQHRSTIATAIRKNGFNSVRLPYADEMVRRNPLINSTLLAANADLVGSTALEVYHAVVESLTSAGLAVIVNNHITQNRWCCDANLCDTLWYNTYLGPFCRIRQSESEWVENWVAVMRTHVKNPFVVGADLRNEVRSPTGRLMWNQWAKAAEEAANALLMLQPNWLMIVEGVQSANDLSGARSRPVELPVPNRLVYSSHIYAWSGWGSLNPNSKRSYSAFAEEMQYNWAWLLDENIAPVWVGEFGAPHIPSKGDMNYWKHLMRFLEEKDADFGYWAINPRKPDKNEEESYSLFEDDWKTYIYDYRTYDMARLAKKK